MRLKEAAKLGFTKAMTPPIRSGRAGQKGGGKSNLRISEISRLPELVELFASDGVKAI